MAIFYNQWYEYTPIMNKTGIPKMTPEAKAFVAREFLKYEYQHYILANDFKSLRQLQYREGRNL